MRKTNLDAIRERERKSPKGKYHAFMKDVSVALGREPHSTDLPKRHPFDLALVRIPPGKALCPYHAHTAEWEMYVVVSGVGSVRHEAGTSEVHPGDVFLFGPMEAHQLVNAGTEDFVYYVIADNPVGTSCYYPDSKKWMVGALSDQYVVKEFRADYFEGEE
jgi:uncharacterized cupin superfamily protein